ncbi:hypothetical protein [uncultured Clostridium sp.]|uniref:hypothetical protein n=1 Tax=uncultured Clostridium sp. TaxID=59620 RepID=UPI0025E9A07E|nr:hypothetical protein [uncultured Clostridium sp.]
MYIYKPEDGFSVSVLYVNKDVLNINLLQNASEIHENEEDDTDKNNVEVNLSRCAEIKENSEYYQEEDNEAVNSRLVFDDEDYSNDEVIKMVHKRKMNEDSMCTLIFDAANTDID